MKIVIENHAGDMQAWELVILIEGAGSDYVGATIDSGNAAWTLEDPLVNLELLAPYAASTGIRDCMIWETEDGAVARWTAMGEGIVDFKTYMKRLAELCPQVSVQLEIISPYARAPPYLKEDFWEPFQQARDHKFARFLALARKGKPIPPYRLLPGKDCRKAEREYEKAELARSIRYCKQTLGLGRKL